MSLRRDGARVSTGKRCNGTAGGALRTRSAQPIGALSRLSGRGPPRVAWLLGAALLGARRPHTSQPCVTYGLVPCAHECSAEVIWSSPTNAQTRAYPRSLNVYDPSL